MKKLISILIALVVLMLFPVIIHAKDDSPINLPFKTENSLLMVTVYVDGQPKKLIFDTGAQRTMINDTSNIQHIVKMTIGEHTINNFPLIMANLSSTDINKAGADGVLGQDVISQFANVSIDYKSKKIQFTK